MWEIHSFSSYFLNILLCAFALFLFTKIILGKSVETKGDFFEHQRLAKKESQVVVYYFYSYAYIDLCNCIWNLIIYNVNSND